MSSTGANRETEGGTMKNVVDNPQTEPQSHKYAEDQAHHGTQQKSNKCNSGGADHKPGESSCGSCDQQSSTNPNRESKGGTLKNVIDNPETKPQSHKYDENPSHHNTQQGSNKCSSSGADHKPGESSCDSCHKK